MNKILRLNENSMKILALGNTTPILRFRVRGTSFPCFDNNAPTNFPGSLTARSSAPNTMHIDYGDGTSADFTLTFISGNNYYQRILRHTDSTVHYYPEYETLGEDQYALPERVITISFTDPQSVIYFSHSYQNIYGEYPNEIGLFPNLGYLGTANTRQVTKFPLDWRNSKLTGLQCSGLWQNQYKTQPLPLTLLDTPLTSLIVSGSYDFSDMVTSNFALIPQKLKDTLVTLGLTYCSLPDLPSDFVDLTKLRTLYINDGNFEEIEKIPDLISTMTWLTTLYLVGGSYSGRCNVREWPDLSNFTNLQSLYTYNMTTYKSGIPLWSTTLPDWFYNLYNLKTWTVGGVYWQTQERCDEFVNNFYDYVVAHASITDTGVLSTNTLRDMRVNYYTSSTTANLNTYNKRPSGILQQPVGYVQGVNNGTPSSPLEKIWVLQEQYDQIWTIRPEA